MIFGGFAPFIATALVADTGDAPSPAWYVAAACALSFAIIAVLYRSPAGAAAVRPGRTAME